MREREREENEMVGENLWKIWEIWEEDDRVWKTKEELSEEGGWDGMRKK